MMRWLAVLAVAASPMQDENLNSNSYKGKSPPEVVSEKTQWVNASDALKLEKLKGKVVWLEFSFLN